MSTQTKLLAPHMAVVSALGTFDLNNTTGLQNFAGAAAVIPMMKLNPDHVTDFLGAIDTQMKSVETANQKYWKSAVGKLKDAKAAFVETNKTAQNGSGHTGAHAEGQGVGGHHGGERRAS